MPSLIGGIAALIALAAGILFGVEPVTCVLRAALAFVLASFFTQLWYVFFTVRVTPSSVRRVVYEEPPEAPAITEATPQN